MANRSIFDILGLDPHKGEQWDIIKSEYIPVDISKVKIDGDEFTNYGGIQFAWEKSYFTEPKRSSGGRIGNLNSYSTLVVPHLIFNFSIMSIDDYRAIVKKDLEKNEFVVECYDPIYNKITKNKMYFAPLQMAKLYTIHKNRFNGNAWEEFIELAGVHEYTVEMIGTNNDLDLVSVVYHLNPPSDTGVDDQFVGEQDVYKGEEIIIGGASNFQNETFNGKYKFKGWNISKDGGNTGNYIDGDAYTINSDLVLYAQWQNAEVFTLSYNYGVADPLYNNKQYNYITSKLISKGNSIGELPIPETPFVEVKNEELQTTTKYYPYINGKWYKIPQLTANANEFVVKDNDLYWDNRDITIYYLYNTVKYVIRYYVDGVLHSISRNIEFNSQIPLPELVKNGYTLNGWYTTSDFKEYTKISGNMPPYNLTLYAKFDKEEE